MAILDTILSTPVDIAALRAEGASQERILDGAFTNLLHYAKSHWSYVASQAGQKLGERLLDGTLTTATCGNIADALRLVFIKGLGIKETDAHSKDTGSGTVWTSPAYTCFDPKVHGNVRKLDGQDYNNGCIFSGTTTWSAKASSTILASPRPTRWRNSRSRSSSTQIAHL